MIDTRIETFLMLCRVMNYRKTAELLNMTQPAVTQHIHFLEEQYGCKLFSYDRRTLTMTKEAELLQKYAENVLYQEKKLKAELEHSDGVSLSIGATKTIGEYVIDKHFHISFSAEKQYFRQCGKHRNIVIGIIRRKAGFCAHRGLFRQKQICFKALQKRAVCGTLRKKTSFCKQNCSD